MNHDLSLESATDSAAGSAAGGIASRVRGAGRGLRWAAALPFLGLIWIYQRLLSPSIPAIFGPTCTCRYYPTCSCYAAEALRTHGVAVGLVLAVGRLLRCTPFHRGGLDPVPPAGWPRRACRRVSHETRTA